MNQPTLVSTVAALFSLMVIELVATFGSAALSDRASPLPGAPDWPTCQPSRCSRPVPCIPVYLTSGRGVTAGIASLAPRITGSERTGRWAMALVAIFVGGALTRRLLDEFSLDNPSPFRRVNVPWEIIQTFGPAIVLGLGVYVAARVGWSVARRCDRRALLAAFATAAVVAGSFAGIDFMAFVILPAPVR